MWQAINVNQLREKILKKEIKVAHILKKKTLFLLGGKKHTMVSFLF